VDTELLRYYSSVHEFLGDILSFWAIDFVLSIICNCVIF
jgi:hypothetical protein